MWRSRQIVASVAASWNGSTSSWCGWRAIFFMSPSAPMSWRATRSEPASSSLVRTRICTEPSAARFMLLWNDATATSSCACTRAGTVTSSPARAGADATAIAATESSTHLVLRSDTETHHRQRRGVTSVWEPSGLGLQEGNPTSVCDNRRMRPAPLRTDRSNAFAHYSMSVRVPKILEDVISRNPDLPAAALQAVGRLRDEIAGDAKLPPLRFPAADAG